MEREKKKTINIKQRFSNHTSHPFKKDMLPVALAGFALPECPGSSPHVYPAHEGLTAVVHRGLVPSLSRVRPSMCTPVIPAVPYLLLGLQDVQ